MLTEDKMRAINLSDERNSMINTIGFRRINHKHLTLTNAPRLSAHSSHKLA